MKKNISIAIDGPVGSGKGTLAVALARKIGALYIYTGGMYRALTLACLRNKIDINSEDNVLELLKNIDIELRLTDFGTRVFLNGKEVSEEIFTPKIANTTPIIAAFSSIRKEMVIRQKELTKGKAVVVEGRDSATDVVPNADMKIYLTADIKVRAQRRCKQLEDREIAVSFGKVLKDLRLRDKRDSERQASPLKIVKDAYVLDTTHLTVGETVNKVLEKLKKKNIL